MNTAKTEDILNIENLKRIAAMVVKTFGKNCEVVIHDFSQLPYSMVHVEGIVYKQNVGTPVANHIKMIMKSQGDDAKDICNHKYVTDSGKILKSSTSFLRNDDGKIIGAMSVNFDITEFLNHSSLIEDIIHIDTRKLEDRNGVFASSLNETIESMVDHAVRDAGKQASSMNKDEKVELVKNLEGQGAFQLKGAV
ncbi:MAG: transcriptional regulator, partial [Desulfobulbaceae bacterium]|nr:transcriptional regulator [Desulfobulbaceae bacterium]